MPVAELPYLGRDPTAELFPVDGDGAPVMSERRTRAKSGVDDIARLLRTCKINTHRRVLGDGDKRCIGRVGGQQAGRKVLRERVAINHVPVMTFDDGSHAVVDAHVKVHANDPDRLIDVVGEILEKRLVESKLDRNGLTP